MPFFQFVELRTKTSLIRVPVAGVLPVPAGDQAPRLVASSSPSGPASLRISSSSATARGDSRSLIAAYWAYVSSLECLPSSGPVGASNVIGVAARALSAWKSLAWPWRRRALFATALSISPESSEKDSSSVEIASRTLRTDLTRLSKMTVRHESRSATKDCGA